MKKLAKIFSLLLVLALCVTGIVLAVSADEPAAQATEPSFAGVIAQSVTLDAEVVDELLFDGFVALVFDNEADFLAAAEEGYDALYEAGVEEFVHPSAELNAYVYLLEDVKVDATNYTQLASGQFSNKTVNWVFNLGGNKIDYALDVGNGYQNGGVLNFTYVNGDFTVSATQDHAHYRFMQGTVNVAYIDININSDLGGNVWKNENTANFNLYAQDSYLNYGGMRVFYMGQTAGQKCTFSGIFKNTELITAAALINYNNSPASATSPSIYFDADCKLNFGALVGGTNTGAPLTITVEAGVQTTAATGGYLNPYVANDGLAFATVGTGSYPSKVVKMEAPASVDVTASGDIADATLVVYADEAAFLSDVAEGVIDGLNADGATVGTAATAIPTSGYVCFLKNFTQDNEFVLTSSGILSFNLNGKTYTVGGAGGSGKPARGSITGIWHIFNGTFQDGFNTNTPSYTINAGSHLIVKDVTLKSTANWENLSATFRLNGAGNIATFENVDVQHTGARTSIIRVTNSNAVVNLKGVTYSNTKAHTTYNTDGITVNQNGCYYGLVLVTNGSVTVNADKNTVINSGYFVNKAAASLGVNLNLELGFKMNRPDFMNDYNFNEADKATYGWNVASNVTYLKDGEAVTENVGFTLVDGLYLLNEGAVNVTFFDENGKQLFSGVFLPGDVPSYSYTMNGGAIERDGKVYMTAFSGWALAQGGEIVEIPAITAGEPARAYYCVLAETLAAVVVYDADGAIADCWAEASLTKAQFGALTQDSTLKLFTDIEIEPGVEDNAPSNKARFNNLAADVTIDLNGFTLKVEAAGKSVKRISANGHVLTIKNGYMTFDAAGRYEDLFESSNAGGTIKLVDVNITGKNCTGPLFDFRHGTLEIYGGSINFDKTVFSFQVQNSTATLAEVNAKFYGVEFNAGDLMGVHASNKVTVSNGVATEKISKFNLVIDDLDGKASVINCAKFFSFGTVVDLSNQSTFTVSVSDTYIKSTNILSGNAPTWYDEDTKTMAANPDLEASNIKFSFTNVYTSVGIGAYENATVNTGIRQDLGSGNGGYAHLFGATPKADTISASLTLYADFTFNLFIPKNSNIIAIKYNGEYVFDKVGGFFEELDADTYKVSIKGIAPNAAANVLALTIVYVDDITIPGAAEATECNFHATAKYSITKYLAGLVASEDASVTDLDKQAARVIAAYALAAYDYFTETAAGDEATLAKLAALVDADTLAYVNGFDFGAMDDEDDFVEANVNAVFNADSAPILTLTFEDGVAWTVNGKSGVGGKCIINLRAFTLCDTITITAGDETATFGLGEYVANRIAQGAGETELSALKCFYAYGAVAKALADAN